jgi:hypothetical protein
VTTDLARTNGDFVEPVVAATKAQLAMLREWVREHPDEVAVGAIPYLAVIAATSRHRLSLMERFIVAEAGYWLGVLAVREYRRWKTKPAGGPLPGPRLRKVS